VGFLHDPFSVIPGFDLEERIRSRASACGIELDGPAAAALAHHARAVLRENDQLHLTSIAEPLEFFERHLGESFEGAGLLPGDASGLYLDIGSGNGYPGLPLSVARPGLRLLMAEASVRKAAFLRSVVRDAPFPAASVVEIQVQRPADLPGVEPARLITSRALGGWAKILPRLRQSLAADGEILVWAGQEAEKISRREVWKRYRLEEKRLLPERENSWVWLFRPAGQAPPG
jgi:16S rRNA (guanine527-N7)-methyltransferase